MTSPLTDPVRGRATGRSDELFGRARAVTPGGVNSPVRAFDAVGGSPRFIASARGAWLTDVDGNEYVDLICSWGPMLLGHAHPEVQAAVADAVARDLGIDQAFAGACISLGRKSGTLQFAHKDDTAVNLYFTGRMVASVKEAVCKGTLWALRREASKPGSAFWVKGGPRPELPVFAPKLVTET